MPPTSHPIFDTFLMISILTAYIMIPCLILNYIFMKCTGFNKEITIKQKHIDVSHEGKKSYTYYLIIDTDHIFYKVETEMYYLLEEGSRYNIQGYGGVRYKSIYSATRVR